MSIPNQDENWTADIKTPRVSLDKHGKAKTGLKQELVHYKQQQTEGKPETRGEDANYDGQYEIDDGNSINGEPREYNSDLSPWNWWNNTRIMAAGTVLRNLADAVSVPYHYRRYSDDRYSVYLTDLGNDETGQPIPTLRVLIYLPTKGRSQAVPGTVQEGKQMGKPRRRGVLVHLAGGGFTMCRPENEGHLCRTLCDSLSCIVISPDYIKAPHHPYPAALNQCHALLRWIADPSGMLSFLETQGPPSAKTFIPMVDPTKIALSGGSSGGNLAAALVIKALHAELPLPNNTRLVGLGLLYAMLDISMPYQEKLSYVPDKSKVLPRWLTRLFLDGYLSDLRTPEKANKLKNPYLSPGLCSTEDLKRFPKTVVITAENDYLCREGELFADRLEKEAGFKVGDTLFRHTFKGVGHGFDITPNATKEMEEARDAAWGMITQAFDSEL